MAVIKLPPCTSSHQEEELKGNTHDGTERYKITKKKKNPKNQEMSPKSRKKTLFRSLRRMVLDGM